MNQSEREENTCSRRQARENVHKQVTIGFGFHWLAEKMCATFFSQSQSVSMQG